MSMKIIFLGDAHLKGDGETNEAELIEFLKGLEGVDCLVILGDLFDFWIGRNRVAQTRYRVVLRALKRLAGRGVQIIYVEGNHDFSMGSFFTEEIGATLVGGEAVLTLDNHKFYLSHGDTVDMTEGYRRWRTFLRSPFFAFITAIVPSRIVWTIAMRLSGRSRSSNTKGIELDNRLKNFAKDKIADGADMVVMGHSHKSGVHKLGTGTYANPGGWHGEKTYLVYEKGKIRVKRYKKP